MNSNLTLGIVFSILVAAPATLVHAGKRAVAENTGFVKHLDDSNFGKTVKESKVPVLVAFHATWCGPCKRMAPDLEKLAKEYDGKLLVAKVDVDKCPKLSAQYGVTRVPTLVLLKPGGETIKIEVGGKSLDKLKDFVKEAIEADKKS